MQDKSMKKNLIHKTKDESMQNFQRVQEKSTLEKHHQTTFNQSQKIECNYSISRNKSISSSSYSTDQQRHSHQHRNSKTKEGTRRQPGTRKKYKRADIGPDHSLSSFNQNTDKSNQESIQILKLLERNMRKRLCFLCCFAIISNKWNCGSPLII